MKLENISKIMENMDARHITEAVNYKPKNRNVTRLVALAACIAVIVTSVPLALILNKEETHAHTHDNHKHSETVIEENVMKSFGDIQLANGSLKLNVIQLSNGKIPKGSTSAEKYVYVYEPIDEDEAHLDMAYSALKYHGLDSFEYDGYEFPNIFLGNAAYFLAAGNDEIVTRCVWANYESQNDVIYEHTFINNCIENSVFESGTIRLPANVTEKDIFDLLGTQIDVLNRLLVEELDSCLATSTSTKSKQVVFWDSSDKEVNDRITEILQKNEGKDIDEWYDEYQEISDLGFIVSIKLDLSGNVQSISTSSVNNERYHLDHENIMEEKIRYVSPKIDKYYVCSSSDEELAACAMQLEQYLIDVFKVTGLTDNYTVTTKTYGDIMGYSSINNFGELGEKVVTISIVPTEDHANDVVQITFKTMDGETYYLSQIRTTYNLGGDRYVELIDAQTAISNLAYGYCIGDAGQGCYICREKLRAEVLEYIEKNMTYELVVLPGVVFETNDGKIVYDLPLYEFTSPADENGEVSVAYVIAISYNTYSNLTIDINSLNAHLNELTYKQCPNYASHAKIEVEKRQRVNAMIEEYVNSFPEEERLTARKRSGGLFQW